MLRDARERAGMHIGALSVGLKVPVKKIEALEADRLDQLPDAVFARALASSIARTLKIDPAPILAVLPQAQKQDLELAAVGQSASFNSIAQPAAGGLARVVRQPAVLAGLGLVVGAILLILVPKTETAPESMRGVKSVAASGALSAATVGTEGVSKPAVNVLTEVVKSQQAEPQTGPSISSATSSLNQSPKGDVAVDIGSGAEVQAKVGNSGLIQLTASGASWVEVTDAGGVVQLRKTLSAGENASAGGSLPLKVIIGRLDATTVQVRGKPFDVTPFGKDNVARFEVR